MQVELVRHSFVGIAPCWLSEILMVIKPFEHFLLIVVVKLHLLEGVISCLCDVYFSLACTYSISEY